LLLRGTEGVGMGDVWLLGMVGAFLGWPGVLFTLFVGAIFGSIGGVVLAFIGGAPAPPDEEVPAAIAEVTSQRRGDPLPAEGPAGATLLRTEVPFGPFIELAAATYVLFQHQLAHWYFS
jgi:leader peptidase (prepilin peptidase)/N-methyltransferase